MNNQYKEYTNNFLWSINFELVNINKKGPMFSSFTRYGWFLF